MTPSASRCPRTDAVLAVHLDGDFSAEELASHRADWHDPNRLDEPAGDWGAGSSAAPGSDAADADVWGWEFVSGESLREHLADCTICQRALQRARRLDAALAAAAGRDTASGRAASSTEDGGTTSDYMRQLVERAVCTALTGSRPDDAQCQPQPSNGAPSLTFATSPRSATAVSVPTRQLASTTTLTQRLLPGVLLVAAGAMACWLLFAASTPRSTATNGSTAKVLASVATESSIGTGSMPATGGGTASGGGTENGRGIENEAASAASSFSLEAARRFAGTRGRGQSKREPSPDELASILADRSLTHGDRITAGAQLAEMARASTRTGRACASALLQSLASCGDTGEAELEVQQTMLAQVRAAPLGNVLLQRLQPLLSPPTNSTATPPDLDALAALVVGLRADDQRLDATLRRVVRLRPDLDPIVCQGLRFPTRIDGGAHFLLACWQDRVAIGEQQDTPAAALHWFAGMPGATFTALRAVLEGSRSAPERVRCLLALGCVADDSTTACLLAHLRSSRRLEACAASAALATLPHAALRPLLPLVRSAGDARHGASRNVDDALLRLALCRAGLDETDPWVAALELSDRQQQQLRDAPLTSFPELAGWFRAGPTTAD